MVDACCSLVLFVLINAFLFTLYFMDFMVLICFYWHSAPLQRTPSALLHSASLQPLCQSQQFIARQECSPNNRQQ